MNQQTKVTARHDDHTNRVIQGNHIKDGGMIEYLESRLHYIQCSGSDLKHELAMGCDKEMEPGFYEKLFAELDAEIEMVNSIIEKLKEVQYSEQMIEGVRERLSNIRESMKGGM